jgi:hypothetical protein
MGEWHDLYPARAFQGPQRGRHPYADANHHHVANECTDGADHYSADHHSADHHSADHCASHDHCASAATDDHCASDHIGSHGYGDTAKDLRQWGNHQRGCISVIFRI